MHKYQLENCTSLPWGNSISPCNPRVTSVPARQDEISSVNRDHIITTSVLCFDQYNFSGVEEFHFTWYEELSIEWVKEERMGMFWGAGHNKLNLRRNFFKKIESYFLHKAIVSEYFTPWFLSFNIGILNKLHLPYLVRYERVHHEKV